MPVALSAQLSALMSKLLESNLIEGKIE